MSVTDHSAFELLFAGSPVRRRWAENPLCLLSEERATNRQRLQALERQRQKLGGRELPLQPSKALRCLELVLGDLRDCSDELAQALQRHTDGPAAAELLAANGLRRRKALELAELLINAGRQEQLESRVG